MQAALDAALVRPHGHRHRPPPVDDPPRRPHRRDRGRPHRRARHARRAGRPRRSLRRPAPGRRRRPGDRRPGDDVVTMPLADLRVLDLSTVIAGPNCARYLADFGADVIKVERPDGDSLRAMAWRDERDGQGLWFKLANRGKRTIVLDLKDDADRDLLLDLVDRCRGARRELPTGPPRETRARPRRAARPQPSARRHAHLRLRPGRPVRRAARLRHDRRGDGRVRGDQRRAGRAAAAAADRPDRRGDRAGGGVRHDGRPAQRSGPGRRRQPAGDDAAPARTAPDACTRCGASCSPDLEPGCPTRCRAGRTGAPTVDGSPCRRAATASPGA